MSSRQAFRASNHFGLGPRPDELRQIGADPRGWLHQQLSPDPRSQPWPSNVAPSHETLGDLLQKFHQMRSFKKAQRRGDDRQAALADTRRALKKSLIRTQLQQLGGAVNGGRVLGDWPGLARGWLRDARDLAPATDLRSVYKGILRDHLGITKADLESRVFPASRAAPAISGLIKA